MFDPITMPAPGLAAIILCSFVVGMLAVWHFHTEESLEQAAIRVVERKQAIELLRALENRAGLLGKLAHDDETKAEAATEAKQIAELRRAIEGCERHQGVHHCCHETDLSLDADVFEEARQLLAIKDRKGQENALAAALWMRNVEIARLKGEDHGD